MHVSIAITMMTIDEYDDDADNDDEDGISVINTIEFFKIRHRPNVTDISVSCQIQLQSRISPSRTVS